MSNNRRWAAILRWSGFKKTYEGGGCRCYEKGVGLRTLTVQFWRDGSHRVTHSHHGCSDTTPTDFKTEAEMFSAIKFETERTDSKYCGTKPKGE